MSQGRPHISRNVHTDGSVRKYDILLCFVHILRFPLITLNWHVLK